jgi:hypothetical protein
MIFDAAKGFLLEDNPDHGYHRFDFPMAKFEVKPGVDPEASALVAVKTAVSASKSLLGIKNADAIPVDRIGLALKSPSTNEMTFKDYHVFEVNLASGTEFLPMGVELRWLTFDELQDPELVSESTRVIATTVLGTRKVVAAVISRHASTVPQFLLVWKKGRGYFFPSTRFKFNHVLDDAIRTALKDDLNYEHQSKDQPKVIDQREVEIEQPSNRFGARDCRFQFHLSKLPDAIRTDLERSLQDRPSDGATPIDKPYWGWFTEDELRNLPEISSSIGPLLNAAIQLL